MNTFPTLWREFDNLFRDFGVPARATVEGPRRFMPPADIRETEKSVELHLDMPGVDPSGIEIKLDGNLLTITASREERREEKDGEWVRQERAWGQFGRTFTVPETIDGTKPEATYKHGVLTVVLPKKEAVLPKTFKVKVEA